MRYRIALALVVAFASSCVAAADAQHTSGNPDRSHAGRIIESAPLSFQGSILHDPLWTLEAPRSFDLLNANETAVGDGAVFFGEASATGAPIFAIDEHTGKRRWTSSLHMSSLRYAGGLIVGLQQEERAPTDARIVALDSRTGQQRWSTRGTAIEIVRQLAFVVHGSHLEARDAVSGKLFWRAVWGGQGLNAAEIDGTTLLLFGWEDGAVIEDFIYAYDVRNGRALWQSGANAILGVLPSHELALDTTSQLNRDDYRPFAVTVLSPLAGTTHFTHEYAPDPERWKPLLPQGRLNAEDAAVDGDAIVFRIGPQTVYRYPMSADPNVSSGTRYELGQLTHVTAGTWLVHLPDGTLATAKFAETHITLHRISSFGVTTFTGVYENIAFIAARSRAVIFDPTHPSDAVVTRFPCSSVSRAYIADGALVAICSTPAQELVALELPNHRTAVTSATPIPIKSQPLPAFAATMHAVPLAIASFPRETDTPAFAADGTLWFSEHIAATKGVDGHTDLIGHLKADGTIEEFHVPTFGAYVSSMTRGPDGAMWFTEGAVMKIGRIAADGAVIEYPLPSELHKMPTFRAGVEPDLIDDPQDALALAGPRFPRLGGVVSGPDGALWCTAMYVHAIVRMTTSGVVRVFPLPSGLTHPGAITNGPGQALWFTARNAIGRLSLSGEATRFPIPGLDVTSVVAGGRDNIWFSSADGHVGELTSNGKMNVFPPPPIASPSGPLIGDCDGALYLGDSTRPTLWRVSNTGEYTQHDVPYHIGEFARAANCTLGFTESQGMHVGTISIGPSANTRL